MHLQHLVRLKGVFRPEELDLLSRVFAQSTTPYDSKDDRIDRALTAITLFRSGVTDEAALVRLVSERLFTADVEQAIGGAC